MNILTLNTKAIYAIGDLHGNFKDITYLVKTYDINGSVIIVCGDVGVGFNKPDYYFQTFKKIEKELKTRNVYVLFVRGNHDDPEYFTNDTFDTKHIKFVRDYSIIQFYDLDDKERVGEHFNILAVGGAISIDRTERIIQNKNYLLKYQINHVCSFETALQKSSKCYWENEAPVFNLDFFNEIKNNNIKIDAVVTHTSPQFCQPRTKDGIRYWMELDKELEQDIEYERQIMSSIYNKLIEDEQPIKQWIYGHYHFHNMETINDVRFTLLDMDRNGKIDFIEIKRFD